MHLNKTGMTEKRRNLCSGCELRLTEASEIAMHLTT